MKCLDCSITILELPEDASYEEKLCDTCYRNLTECKFCGVFFDSFDTKIDHTRDRCIEHLHWLIGQLQQDFHDLKGTLQVRPKGMI
jgi:hypothetical protein